MWPVTAIVWLSLTGDAAAYDNGAPHSRMPPLGWSSWVALSPKTGTSAAEAPSFDFCDEVSVKASIDAFAEVGLYDVGYRHFHLDDCWADVERNASGFLQAERDHFPNGMKPIVDYAHSKGLTFGLYTCAGVYTCVGKRPGSKGHWTQDANVFAEWGVDVVKMDWCNTDGMVPEGTYPLMSAALNKTGRKIHFNMCEWGKDDPWKWGPATAQSWRATGDHTGNWDSTKAIIAQRTSIPASLGGQPFAWNDMDMLESGNYKQAAHANGRQGTMTATEYKTEFSMWAILASPLIVTTPIVNCSKTDQIKGNYTPGTCRPSITDLQKEILLNAEAISVNQDVTPAGRLLQPQLQTGTAAMVYGRDLSDGSVAVALYNPSDKACPGSFDFSLLGWRKGTKAGVRDLWEHKDLGIFSDQFPSVIVDAHATVLLRLTRGSVVVPDLADNERSTPLISAAIESDGAVTLKDTTNSPLSGLEDAQVSSMIRRVGGGVEGHVSASMPLGNHGGSVVVPDLADNEPSTPLISATIESDGAVTLKDTTNSPLSGLEVSSTIRRVQEQEKQNKCSGTVNTLIDTFVKPSIEPMLQKALPERVSISTLFEGKMAGCVKYKVNVVGSLDDAEAAKLTSLQCEAASCTSRYWGICKAYDVTLNAVAQWPNTIKPKFTISSSTKGCFWWDKWIEWPATSFSIEVIKPKVSAQVSGNSDNPKALTVSNVNVDFEFGKVDGVPNWLSFLTTPIVNKVWDHLKTGM